MIAEGVLIVAYCHFDQVRRALDHLLADEAVRDAAMVPGEAPRETEWWRQARDLHVWTTAALQGDTFAEPPLVASAASLSLNSGWRRWKQQRRRWKCESGN